MSLYDSSVPQFKKMLENLDRWLEAAVAHAQKKSFDPNTLLSARLAPDAFALVRQIQAACDNAKATPARLAGKEPPKHPDTETTIDELRQRVRSVLDYLGTFTPEEFTGKDERLIPLFFLPGKALKAADYLNEFGLPNFYFHLTMAYAILRHNGVELGKRDYVGSLKLVDA